MRSRTLRRLAAVAVAALVAQLIIATPASATPRGPDGYAGVWRAIECAQWESDSPWDVDCEMWGDGSTLRLVIGHGETPRLLHTDSYSSYCADELDSPVTHWVSRGIGSYEENGILSVDFTTGGCGSVDIGFHSAGAFYWDPGSDTLWSSDPDGDGYGIHWWRVGG
ncbi:MAG TPA: hypothetical protein VF071_05330 [Candidatus Limnocylindria bacterium]